MGDYLVREAVAVLGCTVDHTRRLLRRGIMRALQFNRVWLIPRAEVEHVKELESRTRQLPEGTFKTAGNDRRPE